MNTIQSATFTPFARVRRPDGAPLGARCHARARGEPCFYCMHEALHALLERGCSGAGAGAGVGAGACI